MVGARFLFFLSLIFFPSTIVDFSLALVCMYFRSANIRTNLRRNMVKARDSVGCLGKRRLVSDQKDTSKVNEKFIIGQCLYHFHTKQNNPY